MNYKKKLHLLIALLGTFVLCGCDQASSNELEETNRVSLTTNHVSYDQEDAYQPYDESEVTNINLSNQTGDVSISKAGSYVLEGALDDGSILINVGKEDIVRLILKDAKITSSSFSAIYASQAKKVIISLEAGTTNTIADGEVYTSRSLNDPTAAIFVQDDVTFNGTGTLVVQGNAIDAISSKDTLKIMEGTYQISAKDDGIVGRDYVFMHSGNLDIQVEGDGMKTTYDTDSEKGDLIIENGNISIVAGNDAFQAERSFYIYDGDVHITTGGGSINSSTSSNASMPGGFGRWNETTLTTSDTPSAKGIKAGISITLAGGNFEMDTSDDAIHSNGSVTIEEGVYVILSGDDGIHADESVLINGGSIDIQKSYEGIEGAVVEINGGDIQIIASDDGMNSAGGSDSTSNNHPGQDSFASGSEYQVIIHGGTIQIDATGDGIDSNGNIIMDGGNVIVYGPPNDGNGALDYDGTFEISGGTLFAIGSSGMAQVPSTSSTQNSLAITLSTRYEANDSIYITVGDRMLGVSPTKQYNSVVISSPMLTKGANVQVYTNGSGGNKNDSGFIESGITGGTLLEDVTIQSSITTIGSMQGMSGGQGGPGGEMKQGRGMR